MIRSVRFDRKCAAESIDLTNIEDDVIEKNKTWVKCGPVSLSFSDREVLLKSKVAPDDDMKANWLSDNHIIASMYLLANAFPQYCGWQDILLHGSPQSIATENKRSNNVSFVYRDPFLSEGFFRERERFSRRIMQKTLAEECKNARGRMQKRSRKNAKTLAE